MLGFGLVTEQAAIQYGDVFVNSAQVARGLKEVRGGNLVVEADGLRFPSLVSVDRLLKLGNRVRVPSDAFPLLKKVGGLHITSSEQTELGFGGLALDSLAVEDSALANLTGLSDTATLSKLVVRNSPLAGLRFPSLTAIGGEMRVENCSRLVVQEMIPAVVNVGNAFRVYNSADVELDLPMQTAAYSFALAFNQHLTRVALPRLVYVGATIDVYQNPLLQTMDAPNLATFGSFANFDPLDRLVISSQAHWAGYSRFTAKNFCRDYEPTFAFTNLNYTLGFDCSPPHQSEAFTHP